VDNRQGSGELAPLITSPHGLCRLEYADFAFGGNGPDGPVDIGIERKSLRDLLSSMTSGRLSGHQLIGITKAYDRVYILVEGVWRVGAKDGLLMSFAGKGKWKPVTQGRRKFMAREVWNFLQTLQVVCGVWVIQTANKVESARWLDSCYRWWDKPWDRHRSHLQFHEPPQVAQLTKPSTVARVASQLEGVGWDKATKIAKRYDRVVDLVHAFTSTLCEIDGIGEKTARAIHDQLWRSDK